MGKAVLAGVGAVLLGLVVVALGRGRPEEPPVVAPRPVASETPLPPAPTDPNDLGIQDPKRADPSLLLGRATTRALRWSKDAVLVVLTAGPVVNGAVDLTNGGSIEFTFSIATGEGFGAGARVAEKGLRILVRGEGTTVDEGAAVSGRAALEPNCPFSEALRKAQATGLLSTSRVSATYEMNAKHGKAAWRLGVDGDANQTRLVDGNSCAILVR